MHFKAKERNKSVIQTLNNVKSEARKLLATAPCNITCPCQLDIKEDFDFTENRKCFGN